MAKGLIQGEAAAAGTGTPAAAAPASSSPAAAPDIGANPGANESARFAGQAPQRPDFIPEKFWKDGKVDLETAFKSYNELETRFTTKTEDLLKQLDADRRKGLPEAPEKYEVQLGDDAPVTKEDLEAHPALDWWRKAAFEAGMPPEKFNEGVTQLVGILSQGPDLEAEAAKLGENARVRIEAVSTWAKTTFSDPEEFKAIQLLGTSAAGIKVLEKIMGKGSPDTGEAAPATPKITIDKLRSMQADPRYWNPTQRDPEFVRQVDDGFAAIYGKTG